MAFTNQVESMGNVGPTSPLIGYDAEQALAHAQHNPSDGSAMMLAQHWATLLAKQRQKQATQQAAHQASVQAASFAPPFGPTAPTLPVPPLQVPLPVASSIFPGLSAHGMSISQDSAAGQRGSVERRRNNAEPGGSTFACCSNTPAATRASTPRRPSWLPRREWAASAHASRAHSGSRSVSPELQR